MSLEEQLKNREDTATSQWFLIRYWMCRRPLHFTVQNSWVTVSIDNISNKNNKEYVLLVTVKVARVTVIVIVILLCTVSHTQWQSCEWCCWFTNATPHWAYEQVGINTWRCFLQIALKSSNVFSMWSNHWGSFSVVYFFLVVSMNASLRWKTRIISRLVGYHQMSSISLVWSPPKRLKPSRLWIWCLFLVEDVGFSFP